MMCLISQDMSETANGPWRISVAWEVLPGSFKTSTLNPAAVGRGAFLVADKGGGPRPLLDYSNTWASRKLHVNFFVNYGSTRGSAIMNSTGHVLNYDTKETQIWTLLANSIACSSVASILICVRLYVRIKILRSAGWDDLAAALATVNSLSPRNSFNWYLIYSINNRFSYFQVA